MKILGSKFLGHDSSVCLIDTDKQEIFAISTERVTRIKHDGFNITPILLEYQDVFSSDEMHICHSFNSFGTDERTGYENRVEAIYQQKYMSVYRELFNPRYISDFGISLLDKVKIVITQLLSYKTYRCLFLMIWNMFQMRISRFVKYSYDNNKIRLDRFITSRASLANIKPKSIQYYDHHQCHAIASYYLSPYCNNKAIALTVDGYGDGFYSRLFFCNNGEIEQLGASKSDIFYIGSKKNIVSIGSIYGNFTHAMGLHRKSDPGKVEALAAYGDKNIEMYNDLMDCSKIIAKSLKFDTNKLKKFYDQSYLKSQRKKIGDANFCATVQCWLEDLIVDYLNSINKKMRLDILCLSGGVTANIIMSLNIFERTLFKNIYVMPAMSDEGTAIGAAILKANDENIDLSWLSDKYMPYYGNSIDMSNFMKEIAPFENSIKYEYLGDFWYKDAAKSIHEKKIIALVNGRMEFGPRALGNRSIIANPMDKEVRDRINLTVKRRPEYQPFCPSILESERERLFIKSFPHKHMAIAFRIRKEFKDILPGATHVDGTARPQFVEKKDNEEYYKLINEFKKLSGYGVLINTSFNLHGRTVVRTVNDAITDFIDCNIDVLYLERYKITLSI